MAIGLGQSKYINPFEPIDDGFSYDVKEYAIGGKLLTVKYSMDDFRSESMDPDDIKRMLVQQMAQEIMNSKLVEFTKIPDMYSGGTTYIARCYLAPNEQIKILRSLK